MGEVVLASDERRAPSLGGLGAPDHLAGANGKRFAARCDRVDRAEDEAVAGGPSRTLSNQDRPGLGRLLEAGCHVHRVTGNQEIASGRLAACHDLAAAEA